MDTILGVRSVIGESWQIVKKQLSFWLLLMVGMFLGTMVLDGVHQWLGNQDWSVLQTVWGIITRLIQMYAGLVVVAASLRAVRGEMIEWPSLVIKDTRLMWHYFLISLVTGLIISMGTLLLIVPGIIFAIMFSLSNYLVVDQDTGIRESLEESKRLTSGKKWKLFVIGLALIGINILGAICLGLGLLVSAPVSIVAGALLYKRLTATTRPEPEIETLAEPVEPRIEAPAEPVKSVSDVNQYQI